MKKSIAKVKISIILLMISIMAILALPNKLNTIFQTDIKAILISIMSASIVELLNSISDYINEKRTIYIKFSDCLFNFQRACLMFDYFFDDHYMLQRNMPEKQEELQKMLSCMNIRDMEIILDEFDEYTTKEKRFLFIPYFLSARIFKNKEYQTIVCMYHEQRRFYIIISYLYECSKNGNVKYFDDLYKEKEKEYYLPRIKNQYITIFNYHYYRTYSSRYYLFDKANKKGIDKFDSKKLESRYYKIR